MDVLKPNRPRPLICRSLKLVFGLVLAAFASGCWAPWQPVHSPGILARDLPEIYRTPKRTLSPRINFSNLTVPAPRDYLLGADDVLEITVPELFQDAEIRPLRTQVMGDGTVQLPLVGSVQVGGMNLSRARQAINAAYADGFIVNPNASVILVQKATVSVVVLGYVNQPGVYPLPKYESDVGHALAAAGGFHEEAAEMVEVHRRMPSAPHMQHPLPPAPQPLNGMGQTGPGKHGANQDGSQVVQTSQQSDEPVDLEQTIIESAKVSISADFVPGEDLLVYAGELHGIRGQYNATSGILSLTGTATLAQYKEALRSVWYESASNDPNSAGRTVSIDVKVVRQQPSDPVAQVVDPAADQRVIEHLTDSKMVLQIPLRATTPAAALSGPADVVLYPGDDIRHDDVILNSGDVVVVPRRTAQVFYVVGPLDRLNVVNFRVRDRDRELGNAFLLPENRDIDVVGAVAMAGWIDPINSPTSVTVHRMLPDGSPMLIRVDLIKARFDRNETLYVEAGDIIYLNPDADWWTRRTFDRVIVDLILAPYRVASGIWIR